MAIIHGGGVRSSIDEKTQKGRITLEDILTVFPFQNTVDLIEIKGKHLREAFEFSVEGYDPKGFHLAGKFLQVSGIQVVYDIRRPSGQRVKELKVRCVKCRVPKYEPIEDEAVYKLALPTYTATGGDGYKMIQNNLINYHRSGKFLMQISIILDLRFFEEPHGITSRDFGYGRAVGVPGKTKPNHSRRGRKN